MSRDKEVILGGVALVALVFIIFLVVRFFPHSSVSQVSQNISLNQQPAPAISGNAFTGSPLGQLVLPGGSTVLLLPSPAQPILPRSTTTAPSELSPVPSGSDEAPGVPQNSVSPSAPSVASVSPSIVNNGDTVTIRGSGFSPTGNTIIAQYGVLLERVGGVSSPDGKTLTFVFSPPSAPSPSDAFNSLPTDVQTNIENQLRSQGASVSAIFHPYQNIANEGDLAKMLAKYGRTLSDLQDPYKIVVINASGAVSSENVILKMKRIINFGQ